ncbi:MAG: hypothetical protein UY42_C0016G0010 [Parcubacteria group bacterium GW2011_GWA2_49_16]|nr:MAG: hypothetical protein UY42_C0016G0010 [Parcubacteria group bacterium GW2011_GWA2_49_16]
MRLLEEIKYELPLRPPHNTDETSDYRYPTWGVIDCALAKYSVVPESTIAERVAWFQDGLIGIRTMDQGECDRGYRNENRARDNLHDDSRARKTSEKTE